nr:amidohydrolase [Novosphingobium marinum]
MAFAALLAASVSVAVSGPVRADVLIDNVNGITLDENGEVERFNAVLVGDDGCIEQVYGRRDKRPGKVDYSMDGRGRTLLPGMIDAHGHVMDLGFAQLTLDLTSADTLAEAQAMIAAYAAAHPDRPWILGTGWNQETWGLGRFPTAADLDEVVSDRPVWLERVDGHAGWANSAALSAAGVTARTADPAGGRIERVAGSQAPTGVFVDAAAKLVEAVVPTPRPEDRDLALAEAQQVLLRNGVTTIADMGTSIEDWQTYRRAGDAGSLQVRIVSYAAGTDAMTLIGGPGPTPWLYEDRLKLNGVKLYVDGALGSRGAALKAPYADDPDNSGLMRMNETQLGNLMSRAAIDNFQVAVHAIGDEANAVVLDTIDELTETYTGDRRWRIEHAQVVDPADIARFGRHGIVASMQPRHQTSDAAMAEARLGSERLAGAYAWKSIAATGATLAFGSDVPVEPPQPLEGMAIAITRQDEDGQPFMGWQPQERIAREDALAGYTTGAAHSLFAEGRLGRIAPGLRADFVMIDVDPLLASPAELRAARVLQTWVGGKMLYQVKETSRPAEGR